MIYNWALIITRLQPFPILEFVEILQIGGSPLKFQSWLEQGITYLLKRKTTIMIVMATISNSKQPPPAAPAITIFVFDDDPPTVGTSSA